jgi:hypothetical protein
LCFCAVVILLGIGSDRYLLLAINFLSIITALSGGWLFWFDFLFPEELFSPDVKIFLNIFIHIIGKVLILYAVGSWISRLVLRSRGSP